MRVFCLHGRSHLLIAVLALLPLCGGCGRDGGAPLDSPAFTRDQLRTYEESANHGDREAEYLLAVAFQQGLGVRADLPTAIHWFRRAADHGHGRAEVVLGALNESGEGIPKNLAQAYYWYERAARRGIADAQFDLAQLLREGNGTGRDPVNALKWYLLASRGRPRVKAADVESAELMRQLTSDQIAEAQRLADGFQPEPTHVTPPSP